VLIENAVQGSHSMKLQIRSHSFGVETRAPLRSTGSFIMSRQDTLRKTATAHSGTLDRFAHLETLGGPAMVA
jgi:hypothetical protein